jgi:uncharacterized membrane protein
VIELNLSTVGWLHTAASAIAIVAFVPAMLAPKGSARHRAAGKVYALAYVVLSLTSLGIYSQQRFWFPHWLAIAGLVVLSAGWGAVRVKPSGWRYVHLIAMLLSAYNLFGGAVNEAFLRITPLREIAGPNVLASPAVGMTHGIVMMTFAALILFYVVVSLARRTTSIHKSQVTSHKLP